MGVKELVFLFSLRIDTALRIFDALRDEFLIILVDKKHYLPHGIIFSDFPLRRVFPERKLIALLTICVESYYLPAFADKLNIRARKEGYDLIVQHVSLDTVKYRLKNLLALGAQGVIALKKTEVNLSIWNNRIIPTVF